MKAQVISFRCVLKNKLGQTLSTSINHNVLTIDGAVGAPLQALTERLQNMKAGERRKIFVPASQAYGFYNLEKLKRVSLEQISEELKMGETVRIEGESTIYRVIALDDEYATLDSNHPLAGQDLIFEVEAMQVRFATPDEVGELQNVPSPIVYH